LRIGIEEGFERYELPALACAALLIVIFPLFDAPLGLGSSLIIAALIARRAGPWWQSQRRHHETAGGTVSA
jgi:hypothetical protein